jgi:HEAT repeat protein
LSTQGETTALETPAERFAAAYAVYGEFLSAISRFGVAPDAALRIEPADTPGAHYEPSTKTIRVGMPDPSTIKGRLHWLFTARLLGLESVEEAVAATADHIPFLIAHEVTHHLRHRYGAPADNDFVEEQAANIVAFGFVSGHPVYRETISRLRDQALRAARRLAGLSPETAPFLQGFRPDPGEVLVARGGLPRKKLDEMRALSGRLGVPFEEVLKDTVAPGEWADAQACLRKADAYFNRRYAASPFEYGLFFSDWLISYAERKEFPTLGESLRFHVLTTDWEKTRKDETALLLVLALHGSDENYALAAAESLAHELEEGAVPHLLEAAVRGWPAVAAGALRLLGRLAPQDDRVIEAANRRLISEEPSVRAMAAAVLVQSGGGHVDAGRAVLGRLLDLGGPAREAALLAMAETRDDAFLDTLADCLDSPAAQERVLALRGLGRLSKDMHPERLSAAMADPEDAVRSAAAACLGARAAAADLPLLVRALDDPSSAVRDAAVKALRARGEGGLPALISARGSPRLETEAVLLLRELGEETSAERLRSLFDELAAKIDRLAGAAASLGAEEGASRLLTEAVGEERRKLLRLAMRLAGAMGTPAGMDRALRALDTGDPAVRRPALDMARGAAPQELWAVLAPRIEARDGEMGRRGSGEGLKRGIGESERRGRSETGKRGNGGKFLAGYPEGFLRELSREIQAAERSGPSDIVEENGMLTTAEKLMFFRAVPTFRPIPLENLSPMAEDCLVERYRPGERVFGAGGQGDAAYIITRGRIAIERDGGAEGPVRVAELGPGQYFGEMALFDGRPRSASAVVLADATLIVLGRDAFLRLGSREPEILIGVIRVLSERLRGAGAGVAGRE